MITTAPHAKPKNKIMLSICIPVYNCANYLGDALDSIVAQAGEGIEIVIYDGGSTDNTGELVAGYQHEWPNIHYHCGAVKGGIDLDLAKCVALSQGEYCWLFSGDDVMRPGAIGRALHFMGTKRDIYLCEHTICDREMGFLREYNVLSPNVLLDINLANEHDRLRWFEHAVSTEAFFSFMSGLVVRRKKWNSGRLIEEFKGSCWAHVARYFDLIEQDLSVCYVAEVWLDQRGDNDSFRSSGLVKRFALAIDGFAKLSAAFFPADSLEALHLRRVVRYEFTLRMFLNAKLLCSDHPERESLSLLNELAQRLYLRDSMSSCVKFLVYRLTPVAVLKFSRFLITFYRT